VAVESCKFEAAEVHGFRSGLAWIHCGGYKGNRRNWNSYVYPHQASTRPRERVPWQRRRRRRRRRRAVHKALRL
jgi:hypothetical protein